MFGILQGTQQSITQDIDKITKDLEEKRGTKIMNIYVPIDRGLVDWVNNYITGLQKDASITNIDVIVHSSGGDPDAAYHIAEILNDSITGELTFIVPRFAKSAATLMVCGGDKIIMGDSSELGPIDPQITRPDGSRISALAVKASLKLLQKEFKEGSIETATILTHKLDALDLGEIDRTLEISKKYLADLLKLRMFKTNGNEEKIKQISEKLTTGYTHHSYLIDYKEAKNSLGLHVEKPNPDEWKIIQMQYFRFQQLQELTGVVQSLQEYDAIQRLIAKRLIRQ